MMKVFIGVVLTAAVASSVLVAQDRRQAPAPARTRVTRVQPLREPVVEPRRVVSLSPARKAAIVKGAGLAVPPGGLETSVVLSPRSPYKGQIAYLVFKNGWVDTGADTFDMLKGYLDLKLNIPKPSKVLVVATIELDGYARFGYADYGPGEMGQAPFWIDVVGNGEEHVPMILECLGVGWYRIVFSAEPKNAGVFKFRQVEVSYLNP